MYRSQEGLHYTAAICSWLRRPFLSPIPTQHMSVPFLSARQNSIMQQSSCISCQTALWQADVGELGRGGSTFTPAAVSNLMQKANPHIKQSQQHPPAPTEETHANGKHSAWSLPDLQAMSTSFSKSVWGQKTCTLTENSYWERFPRSKLPLSPPWAEHGRFEKTLLNRR